MKAPFTYNKEKTLDSLALEPGETKEVECDVNGEVTFIISGEGKPGSSSEAVIIGEVE